jgi:hypothetical protein
MNFAWARALMWSFCVSVARSSNTPCREDSSQARTWSSSVDTDRIMIAHLEFRRHGADAVGEQAVGHRPIEQRGDEAAVQNARVTFERTVANK